jgi:hypothetical protein
MAEACLVTEHEIVFMLDFPCVQKTHLPQIDAITTTRVDRDRVTGMLHPTQRSASTQERPVFQRSTLDLSTDLHPAARAALTDGAASGEGLPCRSLTDHGKRLLNGDLARPPGDPRGQADYVSGTGLALPLQKSARERIVAAGGVDEAVIKVRVEALHLVAFGSETGMALLHLKITTPSKLVLAHVLEVQHLLSNATRSRSACWACEAKPEGRFTVLQLVQSVLSAADCASTPWSRLFTYTYAQLGERPVDDASLAVAAWRLSRHYTGAYAPGPDYAAGTNMSRLFEDVLHAASMEGVASLTIPTTIFMQEAFAGRVRSCYLPLAILGLHEHVQLLDMASAASKAFFLAGPGRELGQDTARALRELVDKFLSFRLRYRLAVVSDITMHNRFYAAVRAGLEVEALTNKLAGDAADAMRALQDRHGRLLGERNRRERRARERRERQRAWALGLFNGLLVWLTSMALFKEVRDVVLHWGWLPEWLHGDKVPAWLGGDTAPAVLAMALGLFSGGMTALRHYEAHAGTDELDEELTADLQGEGGHVAASNRSTRRHRTIWRPRTP